MSDREWTLVGAIVGLIFVVIVVGLFQGEINATAVALALITLLSAWITGLVAAGRFGTAPPKDERDKTPAGGDDS